MRRPLAWLLLLVPALALAAWPPGGGLTKVGGGGGGNISTNSTFATQAPIALYVDSTGSDSNACTASGSSACLTIQGAINKLPKRLTVGLASPAVTITVGAGNFTGFIFEGFTIEHLGAVGTANTTLGTPAVLITGTMATATITSGLTSGTIASATAGGTGGLTAGTATVTAAGWTDNDLRGKFVYIPSGTGAGQLRPIQSNTATVLTVPGGWTAPTGSPFTIVSPATVLNVKPTHAATVSGLATISGLQVGMSGVSQGEGYDFKLSQMKLSLAGANGVYVRSFGRFMFVNLELNSAAGIVVMEGNSASIDVWHSYFNGGNAVLFHAGNRGGLLQNVQNACTQNFLGAGSQVLSQSNYMYNVTSVGWSVSGGGASLTSQGDYVDCVSNGTKLGITMGSNAINGHGGANYALLQSFSPNNCGTGVRIWGRNSMAALFSAAATGNTLAVDSGKGAAVAINSATTLTTDGGVELSVDGVTHSLAEMRAPASGLRGITDVLYGTSVYEN